MLAFALIPAGTFAYGNAGRNLLHGPHLLTTDFSLFKNFRFGEVRKLQFRFSDYNFLNHPVYTFGHDNNLNLAFDATGKQTNSRFGYADNKAGRRVVQLAVKYYF